MAGWRPGRVACIALLVLWINLQHIQRSAYVAAQATIIDATACEILISWSEYTKVDPSIPRSCARQRCSSFEGVTCSDSGHVTKVYLGGYSLKGSLPAQWGALTSVTSLWFRSNKLSGTLPPEWGALTELTEMSLSENSLTGTLPPQWGNLSSIHYLDLDVNNLTGTVPEQWGNLEYISTLNISYTNLSGTIPEQWVNQRWNSFDTTSTAVCFPACPANASSPKLPPASSPALFLATAINSPAAAQEASTNSTTVPGPGAAPRPPQSRRGGVGLVVKVIVPVALVVLAVVVAGIAVMRKRGLARLLPKGPMLQMLPASTKEPAAGGEATDGHPEGSSSQACAKGTDVDGGKRRDANSKIQQYRGSTWARCAAFLPKFRERELGGLPSSTASIAGTGSSPATATGAGTDSGTGAGIVAGASTGTETSSAAPGAAAAAAEVGAGSASARRRRPAVPRPYQPGPSAARDSIVHTPVLLPLSGGARQEHGLRAGNTGDPVEVAAVVVRDVAALLPLCISLSLKIIEASERVVANNARCSQLVLRINALQPFLQQLQEANTRGAGDPVGLQPPQHSNQVLQPVLKNIYDVFRDVHGCILSWCSPTRLGAVVTVLRNMASSSWFQEGFVELNMRLSGAIIDLCAAMNIQDRTSRVVPNRAALDEETTLLTTADMQGLVQELAIIEADGHDSWGKLEPEDKEKLAHIFEHHQMDLSSSIKQARQEALEKVAARMLIPLADITKTRLIGKGGFGKVYAGTWKQQQVALKWLEASPISKRDRADLLREAFIHHRAHSHPNVCPLYGVVLEGDTCVLVMELAAGDLLQLVSDPEGVLPPSRKYALALDVACGMEHLHSKGIVHGDLKPSNAVVRSSGSVAVVDFGLSSVTCLSLSASISAARGHLASSSTALTVSYSPPELLAGRITRKTEAGDVYAFGMLLLEVFTGERPYGAMPVEAIMRHVLGGGKPVVPARVPAECAQLIGSCLDHEPGRRPAFAEICSTLGPLAGR